MALNKRSLVSLALVLGLAAVLAVVGRWMLFTTFMIYDDEGYVLYSLRNYIAHGSLYDRVYSQYGPFFYNFYDTVQRILPIEYDNVSGRWITLINWLTASGVCSLFVWRYSRSVIYMLFTLGITFFSLSIMKSEPMHPGSLLTALVALGATVGAIVIERDRPKAFAITGALVGVALLLIKINVGVFFLAAVGGWMLINTARRPDSRIPFSWLVALGCALLPFLLMQSLWSAGWVRLFALSVTTSALGLVLGLNKNHRPDHTPATWGWLCGVGALWGLLICLLSCLKGTSPLQLMHGVFLDPLNHPNVYSVPVYWTGLALPLAILSFASAAWFYTRPKLPEWVFTIIATLRLVILACFLSSGQLAMGRFGLIYGLPLIWLLVVPLQTGPISGLNRARLWVGLVLVFQSLHAYPVAVSQINWGTFLFPAVLAAGIYETLAYFKALRPSFARGLTALSGASLLLPLAWIITSEGTSYATVYQKREPLALHGAEQVRVTEDLTDTLHILCGNLKLYGDSQFSFPGLYSMNIWTGNPTPTLANASHWFTLLTTAQQQAIIDKLDADPKACVAVQSMVVDFLEITGFSTKSMLRDYLVREFAPALKLDGYAIWIHKKRTIQPINIVSIAQIGPGPRIRLTGVVPIGTQAIGRIELRNYYTTPLLVQAIGQTETDTLTTEPLSPDPRSLSLPPPARLVRFTAEFTAAFNHLNPHEAFVVLKAPDGRVIARLRFAH